MIFVPHRERERERFKIFNAKYLYLKKTFNLTAHIRVFSAVKFSKMFNQVFLFAAHG